MHGDPQARWCRAVYAGAVLEALQAALGKIVVGDPRLENVRMGPVASLAQRREVLEQLGAAASARRR